MGGFTSATAQRSATDPALVVRRMRAIALRDRLPHDHKLRTIAKELENAAPKYSDRTMGPRAFMQIYARACRALRDHTGEFVF